MKNWESIPLYEKKKKYRNANADETTQNILQRDFYATAPNQNGLLM
ncbi:MAG: hypothetical protein ACLU80_00205 [Dorea sp.]